MMTFKQLNENTKFIKNKLLGLKTFKFYESLNYYDNFIVGSNYLRDLVLNSLKNIDNIIVIPTCVDYNKYPKKISR